MYDTIVGKREIAVKILQYLEANDERANQHLQAIEKRLKSSNGLIYRYRHADDFGNPQSTFLVCSFWYAEALIYLIDWTMLLVQWKQF